MLYEFQLTRFEDQSRMRSLLVPFLTLLFWITGVRSDVIAKQTVQESDGRKALLFNITLESILSPGDSRYNVTLRSKVAGFMVDQSSFSTGPEDVKQSSYRAIADDVVLWNYAQLTTEETAYLSYKAKPQFDLPKGRSFYNASLVYRYLVQPPVNDTNVSLPVISPFCLDRVDTSSPEKGFNTALIAVTVVFGFLAGALIVLLILLGVYYMTKRNPFSCCEKKGRPSTKSSPKFKPSEASYRSRYDGITATKSLPWSDSIITVLRLPDQNDIIREIERLDIEDTIRVCRDLDLHRDEAALNLAMNLIRGVVASGTVSKKTSSSCTALMLKQLESVERRMDDRFRQQMEDAELMGREDEKQLLALAQKHEEELNLLMESLKEANPKDVKSVRKLLKEKQQLERSRLQYRNNLRRQEEMEKLVSESSVCKRVARRESIRTCLRDIATASALTPEQLTKEYDRLEMAIAKIFTDAESARLRALEEKLAKRKCLVKTQDLAQSQGRVVLNTVTQQLIQLVDLAKKSGKLSPSNARRVIEDLVVEAQEIKRSGEEEGERRDLELLRKLGDTKKHRIADQRKLLELKLNEIKKKHSSAEMKDSLLLLEVVQTTITRHEEEMAQIEAQIDSDHANDLLRLRELLREESKLELLRSKENLIKDLREIGLQPTKMRPWLDSQEEELQELQQTHQKETKEQLNDLRKQLSDGAVSLNGARQHKRQHQEQLTLYKQAVVRNLIDSQMALTSDGREQVQAELAKEKNKSATSMRALDKLRYRKVMEDKQGLKRHDRIEGLRKKQEQELKKLLRSVDSKKSRDSEDDEGDTRTSLLLNLFENYYNRCLVILKGEEIVMEDEEVSMEFNREQAIVLKEEEERLAVGLVEIQIRKMKEFLLAENERSVLRRVICDLLRRLAEGGVLSATDCQRLLQAHEKELKSITMAQRDDLKIKNLTESRRKILDESSKSWEDDNQNLPNGVKSPTAVKLRQILLLEKQIVEQSVSRNQIEREIRQEVEELKWRDRLKQIQLTLVKELELLATVLKGGRYSPEDVENIFLRHFLPTCSIDWRHFLQQYRISDETRVTTDAKNRLRNTEEASQHSPRTDKADITPSRSLLRLGKLHPLPASVSPANTYDEVDTAGASSSQPGSYLYRKPSYSGNSQLAQTAPSLRLPPITPAVGSKQKKSVRLVETHNEYWSN